MRKLPKLIALTFLAAVAAGATAHGQTIVKWTYENGPAGATTVREFAYAPAGFGSHLARSFPIERHLGALATRPHVPVLAKVWANTGTDYNAGTSWTGNTAPGLGDVGQFSAAPIFQPNLTASISNAGIYFSGTGSFGYDVTSSSTAIAFTLTGVGATGFNGTSNSNAAALRSEITSGTNTVDAPLILGAAAAATQVFYQEAGGTLVVNGAISSTNAVTLSFKGAGTIQLNGSNTFTGGSTIGQAGTTIIVGNDAAFGSGTFSVGNSGTIQAGGGARTISNPVSLSGGTLTVGGSNAFTFGGPVTVAGALTRTLIVNNTATTTLQGSVFLSDAAATARTLVIGGTGNVIINGVVSNFNGAGAAGTLSHSGSGTLTLGNTNTYSGGTLLSGGTTIATVNGALGTGNVSLTAASVILTLQGATNNYIADTANLNIGFTSDTVNLFYTGTETIGSLTVAGMQEAPGIYGGAGSGAANILPEFMGTGTLTVLTAIPEPATYMLMGLGLLVCVQAFRAKKR